MADEKLRFGIVGPGAVAHLHSIDRASGAVLTAVYGRNEKKTQAFALQ